MRKRHYGEVAFANSAKAPSSSRSDHGFYRLVLKMISWMKVAKDDCLLKRLLDEFDDRELLLGVLVALVDEGLEVVDGGLEEALLVGVGEAGRHRPHHHHHHQRSHLLPLTQLTAALHPASTSSSAPRMDILGGQALPASSV